MGTYGREALKGAVVFGLVRGGVPLAEAVAKEIDGKATLENLNVIVCRKVPRPDNKEVAIGSISKEWKTVVSHLALSYGDRLGLANV